MRFGINETASEQAENQHLSDQFAELESKDKRITDVERMRLSETTPDIESVSKETDDDSAKLSPCGPRLNMDERKTESILSDESVEKEISEGRSESHAHSIKQTEQEHTDQSKLDLSEPVFKTVDRVQENDADLEITGNGIDRDSDKAESANVEELQSGLRDADKDMQISEKNNEHSDIQELSQSEKAPSLSEALDDPKLFTDYAPKDYKYTEDNHGKYAYGQLGLSDDPQRNQKAQREAGGEDRRDDDDGGHLIGARFDASPYSENIDAQNKNLNRGAYKRNENEWADALKNDDKVFVNVETYKRSGVERPDAYMGWSVTEHADGTRDWDAFSFTNESNEEQDKWETELEKTSDTQDIPNAMLDDNYDRIHQIIEEDKDL